jgi:predicted acylesterase/phospholipase RssA
MIKYICLPSGGAQLITYLGVIRELIDTKHLDLKNIKGYYGISSGSILSAVLCLGIDFDDVVNYFIKRTWHYVYKLDQINFISLFNDNGILNKEYFIKIFEHLFNSKNMDLKTLTMKEFYDKTQIKLSIFAVNASTFQLKEFNYETTGDILLSDAIYFSSCIPSIFKPYEYKGVCYLDGGIHTNSPVDICIKQEKPNLNEVLGIEIIKDNTLNNPISANDNYLYFMFKIVTKLHFNGTAEVKNTDCDYLIRIHTLNDYGNDFFNKFVTSAETRREVFLRGVETCRTFLSLKNKDECNDDKDSALTEKNNNEEDNK